MSNQALVDASYRQGVQLAHAYVWKPLPTPPEAVRRLRQMTAEERAALSAQAMQHYQETHQAFFAQETAILHENTAHSAWLRDLLGWVTTHHPAAQATVRQALLTHELHAQEVV